MSELARREAEAFFQEYETRAYKRGQLILFANDTPQYAYYLTKGWVKQYDITKHGNEIVVNIFRPGSAFLVLTALTRLPSTYYFSAGSDVTVHRIPVREASHFVSTHSSALQDMLADAYRGYEELLRRMTYLMNGGACGRIVYEILAEAQNLRPNRQGHLHMSITESEIASRTGLTRETVSREISLLRKKGKLGSLKTISVDDVRHLQTMLEELF
jgi:CRP/FNR family cyclic AMP-dependent transcriptional regulator